MSYISVIYIRVLSSEIFAKSIKLISLSLTPLICSIPEHKTIEFHDFPTQIYYI